MSAPELLADLISRGVQLWRDGDLLRYRAPTSMAAGLPALLKAHKAELLSALAAQTVQAARSPPAPAAEVLPPAAVARLERCDGLPRRAAEAQARRAVTPENMAGVTAEPAPDKACTPATPVTPSLIDAEARNAPRHVYRFALRDYPGEAPVVITAVATAAEAKAELERRFGRGRVIACWRVDEVRP